MTGTQRLVRRLAGAGLLLALGAAACSAGSKTTSFPGTTGATPTASGAQAAGSTTCRAGTTTPGAQGGGDVLVPGDISDTAKYVTFHSPDGYHIDHPDGWAQSQSGTGVTFTDKFNSIHVELTPAAVAPSVASAKSTEVPALATTVPCFQAGAVTAVRRTSGPAVLVTYRADSSQDPVTGKVVTTDVERYEFWLSGRQATVTLSSPRGSDNVDPWRTVTDSFAWGS